MTCKFCNAWRPKQSIFYNALFKLHFAWQNVLQQCSFCVSLHFFAPRTEKLDVQEDVSLHFLALRTEKFDVQEEVFAIAK